MGRAPVIVSLIALTASLTACGAHHRRPARHSAAATAHPSLQAPHPCPDQPIFTCSTLRVPLDHAGQAGGTLAVAVGSDARAPAPRGVLLFLSGGPGQPGIPFLTRVHTRLESAFTGFRLVMLDQRGTGAGALKCPALQNAAGASDLAVVPAATVTDCANQIGPARRYYATSETVEDIEQLRLALGVRQLTLDGVSYGTFVAERYALAYPTHVARMVLDSVVPQAGVDPLYRAALSGSARVLRDVCAADHCTSDPAADVAFAVKHLHDGVALLNALVADSVVAPDFPGVLSDLHAARAGDRRPLEAFINRARNDDAAPAAFLSQGLHESALCLELAPPWDPAATESQRLAVLARLAAESPAPELYPFDRATATGNGLARGCLAWPPTRPPDLPGGGAATTTLPKIPILVLAGERDLSTPLAWARAEAAMAPDGQLLEVPGAGHSVQLRGRDPAVRRTLARFLRGDT